MLDIVINWLLGSKSGNVDPHEKAGNGFFHSPEEQKTSREERRLRWGFLEIGSSTWEMASALQLHPLNSLVSVFCLSQEKRQKFCQHFNIPKAYDDKTNFLNIYEIDAIYISGPMTERIENCILGLEKEKHVVVESPIGIDEHGTHKMFSLAVRKKLLFVEALPFMFSPLRFKLQSLIHQGDIGKIQLITINHGIRDEESSPKSALMTLGIHALSLIILCFGGLEPSHIGAVGDISQNLSFDKQVSMSLLFRNNQMASITCSRIVDILDECTLYCTNGILKIPNPFSDPKMIIFTPSKARNHIQLPDIRIPLISPHMHQAQSTFSKFTELNFDVNSPMLIHSPIFNSYTNKKISYKSSDPKATVSHENSISSHSSSPIRMSVTDESNSELTTDGSGSNLKTLNSNSEANSSSFESKSSSVTSTAVGSASLNRWIENSFFHHPLRPSSKDSFPQNVTQFERNGSKQHRNENAEKQNASSTLSPIHIQNGFSAMVKEICRCIENDSMECASMRMEDSMRLMRLLHRVRNHIGLTHEKDIDRMKVASLSDWGSFL